MNKPLQLLHNKVTYKMWLVQFFLLDCDIIKTIKYLVKYEGIKRIIKPLTMKEISQSDQNKTFYNHEGIAYLEFHQALPQYPDQYMVNTSVWYGDQHFICIRYIYMDLNRTILYKFTVDFESSYYDPRHIKIDQFGKYKWHHFDYPIEFGKND